MDVFDSGARCRLAFACECVSVCRGYSDPWAGVAQNRLLPAGTKEEILNIVAAAPKTIAQLAKELGLSQPSVHAHVTEMIESELLRESQAAEKKYPAERYYEPNFPVVRLQDVAGFDALCNELSEQVVELLERKAGELETAYERSTLAGKGWSFADLGQYLFARIQRGARERLEARGKLTARQEHRNGAEWIFWAEETVETAPNTP